MSGLSGVQFALPDALEMLKKINSAPSSKDDTPVLLSCLDPALIYGGGINRDLMTSDGHPLTIVRSPSNHLALADGEVFLVSENHFQRLAVLKDLPDSLWQATIHLLKNYLKIPYPHRRANRIEIHQINHLPAAAGPFTERLIKGGFEKEGENLVLWADV